MGQHKHNPQALYFKSNPKKMAHLSSGEPYECVDFEARLVPLEEIFPADLVGGMKKDLRAEMTAGQCHKNAWKFAQMFKDAGMEYCEGILLPEGLSPIHH